LPEDPATLKALLLAALTERDREQQRADELYVQTLRLQLELERYKKWYYGPRADRLRAPGELAQALLNFGLRFRTMDVSGRRVLGNPPRRRAARG
jgi:hypothetical protein